MKNNIKIERPGKHTRSNIFFLVALFISFEVILLPYCLLSNESSSGHYCLYKKKRDQIGKQREEFLWYSFQFLPISPYSLGIMQKMIEQKNESKNDSEI